METQNLPASTCEVTTTRPVIPPYSKHPTIVLEDKHVVLRPLQPRDLEAFHELRSQIEVMKWTSTGKVDADVHATRTWMARFIEMEDDLQSSSAEITPAKIEAATARSQTFNFTIAYFENSYTDHERSSADETVIGVAGFHKLEPEPECGYMIRKEFWGRGIATAVLKTIMDVYWGLERVTVKLEPSPEQDESLSHSIKDSTPVREIVKAVIESTNIGSQRVLEKCGFQQVSTEIVHENGVDVPLTHYILQRP